MTDQHSQEPTETPEVSPHIQEIIDAAFASIRGAIEQQVAQANVDLKAITDARTGIRSAIATMISLEAPKSPLLSAETDEAFFAALSKDETMATKFLTPEVGQLLAHIKTLADRVIAVTKAAAPIFGTPTQPATPTPTPTTKTTKELAPQGQIYDTLLEYVRSATAEGTNKFRNSSEIHTLLGCSRGTAQNAFRQLVAAGILKMEGRGKATMYIHTLNTGNLNQA